MFFITILATAYAITASLRQSQLKTQLALKQEYEKDIDNVNEIAQKLANTNGTITITQEDYTNLLNRIVALESRNQYFEEYFENVDVTTFSGQIIASLTLPAGKYVIVGQAEYEGTDLRYFISIQNSDENAEKYEGDSSAYDNFGNVGMNVSTILSIENTQTIKLQLWTSKDITLRNGYLKAIKISD